MFYLQLLSVWYFLKQGCMHMNVTYVTFDTVLFSFSRLSPAAYFTVPFYTRFVCFSILLLSLSVHRCLKCILLVLLLTIYWLVLVFLDTGGIPLVGTLVSAELVGGVGEVVVPEDRTIVVTLLVSSSKKTIIIFFFIIIYKTIKIVAKVAIYFLHHLQQYFRIVGTKKMSHFDRKMDPEKRMLYNRFWWSLLRFAMKLGGAPYEAFRK